MRCSCATTHHPTNSAALPPFLRARRPRSRAKPAAAERTKSSARSQARTKPALRRPPPATKRNSLMHDRSDLAVTRLRHPLKFRLLQVKQVRQLTPHLTRVTLTGDDLHDFGSASFDDHVKVF